MVTFNVEKDYEDEEAKEKLANLFREFVMSEDEVVLEVLPKFIDSITDVLIELGIIEKEEDTPEEDIPEKDTSEEDTPEEDEDISPDEIPTESKKEKKLYRLVENANNFIY